MKLEIIEFQTKIKEIKNKNNEIERIKDMIDDNNNIFQIYSQIQTKRKEEENEKGNDDNFEQLEFN
jgi:hypothetical protein